MCLSSKVKDFRGKLLQNCKYAIARLEAAKKRVIYYSSNIQKDTTTGSSTPDKPLDGTTTNSQVTKRRESDISFEIHDKEIMNSFMILTHGVLIQEWEHFLYDVFTEGVVYYAKGYDLANIRYKFSLENFNPIVTIEEMRANISAELERSPLKYETLFKESRNLFKIDECALLNEIKKQVQVRHIFQHNQGKIRRLDLDAIGSNGPDACFYILDDERKLQSYKEDQEIWLSLPEIEKLYAIIEQYSEKFLIQAATAKLIKADSTE